MQKTLIAIALASAFSMAGCRLGKNFHAVEPGKLYRSAQLTGPELSEAIERAKIKTIINLRGPAPDEKWYRDEVATARKYGVTHIDIAMRPRRLPYRDDIIQLFETYRTAERPMLIHCQMGADRTGEAAALYALEYMGATKDEALDMMTPKFNHYEFLAPAKKYFVRIYQGLDWAYNYYDPCDPAQRYKYFDQESLCPADAPARPESREDNEDRSPPWKNLK